MLKVTVSIVPGGHGAERQLGHLLRMWGAVRLATTNWS